VRPTGIRVRWGRLLPALLLPASLAVLGHQVCEPLEWLALIVLAAELGVIAAELTFYSLYRWYQEEMKRRIYRMLGMEPE
jgi:hypothetical protein